MRKYQDKGNLWKKDFMWGLQFQRVRVNCGGTDYASGGQLEQQLGAHTVTEDRRCSPMAETF